MLLHERHGIETDELTEELIQETYDIINQYDNIYLEDLRLDIDEIDYDQELQKTKISSEELLKWLNQIDCDNAIVELTKPIIDELVENIFIYENKSLKVVLKFENEYKEAIHLLKHQKN